MTNPDAPRWQGKYRDIVYLTIEDDGEGMIQRFLDGNITEEQLIAHLSQWDHGESPLAEAPSWGTQDRIYRKNDLVLSWNPYLGYASLTALEKDDE